MFSLLLSLALAAPYDLNDAGVVFELPGWETARWTNWDFRSTNAAGPMAVEIWYTPWQQELTEEVGRAQAALYRDRLEALERAKNIRMENIQIQEVQGRTTALLTVRFNFDRVNARGILWGATFPGDGKMVHVAVYGPAESESKIKAARQQILTAIRQISPPAATSSGPVDAPYGKVSFPAGWRLPLASEAKEMEERTKLTGEADPTRCVTAIHPLPIGAPDVLTLCTREWHFGPLDEASFPDRELSFRQGLYGKAADKVAAGALLPVGDRNAVAFSPELGGYDMRTVVLPYENKVLVAKVLGAAGTGEALQTALNETLSGIAWTGPDNGKPSYTFGETLVHGLKYNPFHPLKLLCVVLSLGAVAFLAKRVLGREGNTEVT